MQQIQNCIDDLKKHYANSRNRAFSFLTTHNDKPFIIKAAGFPLTDQEWPRDRELSNIEKLHTPQSSATLLGNIPNPINHFVDMIPANESAPIIVDIGAGTGRGLDELRQMFENKNIKAKCGAVGVTPLNPE